MSRKDDRRAIALYLPADLRSALRARQHAGRRRSLMDTLRRAVECGLARTGATADPDPAPSAPHRHRPLLLQLPRATRIAVRDRAAQAAASDAQMALALARIGLAMEKPAQPPVKPAPAAPCEEHCPPSGAL
ncbi:MAG: hypothetical protein KDA50_02265 [Rhodobacteraceae bacterium]|nr:hypothetical protein [Paracoccaceae bacterium]